MSLRAHLFKLLVIMSTLSPLVASAATISIDPATGTYGPGDTFIETIRVDNDGDCINAANISLSYPKDTLRAVDFSRGDSIFSLWAIEPHIDTDQGTVAFAGGIPGGYCGRIPGDTGITNVLGKVIFTVINASAKTADIHFTPATAVYLNDGAGTLAPLKILDGAVNIAPSPQLTNNQWLSEVGQDTTPPQPFQVHVESTSGVYNGRYYIVFSTIDKESGLDHYEIFENKGWRRITSPYLLKSQSLLGVGDIQVRAIDKAGNIRVGDYSASTVPKRQLSLVDFIPFIILALVALFVVSKRYYDHRRGRKNKPM